VGDLVHPEIQPQTMKIMKYAAVGAVAAATDFLIFAIFAKLLNFNYLVIGAVGFIIATFINYFLSIRFVFESGIRFAYKKEISLCS
jgi:putative flippase GtrA